MAKQRITPYGIIHEAESDHQYVSAFGTTFDETGSLTLRIKPAPAAAKTSGGQDPLINGKRYVLAAPAQAGTYAQNDLLIGNNKIITPARAEAGVYAHGTCPFTLWVNPGVAYCVAASDFSFIIRKYAGEGAPFLKPLSVAGAISVGGIGVGFGPIKPLEVSGAGYGNQVGTGSAGLHPLEADGDLFLGRAFSGSAEFPPLDALGDNTSFTGSGSVEFVSPLLDGTLLRGVAGNGEPELPALLAFGYGLGIYDGEFLSSLRLTSLNSSGVIEAGQAMTGSAQMPRLSVAGDQIALNFEGVGAATLPILQASGVIGENAFGTGAAIFPSLDIIGDGGNDLLGDISTGFAMVQTAAMNERVAAVTDWEWPFNAFAIAGGFHYGSSSEGIFVLDGPSDDGAAIPCDVRKLEMDFKSPLLKRATDAYIRLRSDNPYDFTILADGVPCVLPVDDDLDGVHGKKVNLPRGLKGRRLGVSVSNTSGADLTLEKMDLQVEVLSRRGRTQNG